MLLFLVFFPFCFINSDELLDLLVAYDDSVRDLDSALSCYRDKYMSLEDFLNKTLEKEVNQKFLKLKKMVSDFKNYIHFHSERFDRNLLDHYKQQFKVVVSERNAIFHHLYELKRKEVIGRETYRIYFSNSDSKDCDVAKDSTVLL